MNTAPTNRPTPIILDAYEREDGTTVAYCPRCDAYHSHGSGSGHRVAHCDDKGAPGYYLRIVGPLTPDIQTDIDRRRQEQLRRLRRRGGGRRAYYF